jgi:predicted KAP-like P-loop ATPase
MNTLFDTLSADHPIKGAQEDLLGRTRFAGAVARAIRRRQGQDSFVIALYGPWGCGKSSIKNMIMEALRNDPASCPLIVDFEPWLWNDVPSLTKAFFDEIGAVLDAQAEESQARTRDGARDDEHLQEIAMRERQRARRWKQYGSLFTAGGFLLKGVGLVQAAQGAMGQASLLVATASQLDEAAKAAGHAAETLSNSQNEEAEPALSLAQVREELGRSLCELERPLLVVVDDIDRLDAAETTLLFQLVKANANFPNLVYLLLFQRDSVERSLEQISPGSGREFLEKIVQAGFDVPVIDGEVLHKVLGQSLQETLAGLEREIHEQRLRAVLPRLAGFFDSVRDVRRFCNSLAFHLDVLRDEETGIIEVDPADLIGLEALRVFEPDIYARLARNKDLLTTERQRSPSQGENQKLELAVEAFVASLIEMASEPRRDAVKKLLGTLFPQVYWAIVGLRHLHNDVHWGRALMALQVCHPAIFDRYFQLAVNAHDIAQVEWRQLLAKTGDRTALTAHLSDFSARGLLPAALERLTVWADRVPLEHAASFLTALFDVGNEFPSVPAAPGFPFWGQELQARALVQRYFKQGLNPYESEEPAARDARRSKLAVPFAEALRQTTGCFFPVYLVAYENREWNREQGEEQRAARQRDEEYYLLNEADSVSLRADALNLIRHAAQNGSLLEQKNRLLFVLHCWREWGSEDEVSQWLNEVLAVDTGVVTFLRRCTGSIVQWTNDWQVGNTLERIELGAVHSCVPLPQLETRLKRLDLDALDKSDRAVIESVRHSIRLWREGKLTHLQSEGLPDPQTASVGVSDESPETAGSDVPPA